MANRKILINREIRRSKDTLQGTVVTDLNQQLFDPNGNANLVWVVDVNIGGEVSGRVVRNCIVKQAGGAGGRAYAKLGLGVQLKRTLNGRWNVTGPSDRVLTSGSVVELDEDTGLVTTGLPRTGFTVTKEPYDYYRGNLPGTPGSGLYGSPGFPKFLLRDGDGNPV